MESEPKSLIYTGPGLLQWKKGEYCYRWKPVNRHLHGLQMLFRTALVRSLPGHLNFGTAAGMEVASDLAGSLKQMGYTHDDSTLADMAQRVVRIVRRGINQILVRPSPSPEGGIDGTLEAFATKVMPVVRRELE